MMTKGEKDRRIVQGAAGERSREGGVLAVQRLL